MAKTKGMHDLYLIRKGQEIDKFTAEVDLANPGQLRDTLLAAMARKRREREGDLPKYELRIHQVGNPRKLMTFTAAK